MRRKQIPCVIRARFRVVVSREIIAKSFLPASIRRVGDFRAGIVGNIAQRAFRRALHTIVTNARLSLWNQRLER